LTPRTGPEPFGVKNPDLFANSPERVKKLKRQADKALRERKRKQWWIEHGNNHAPPQQEQR
jgi:hypothetical protein